MQNLFQLLSYHSSIPLTLLLPFYHLKTGSRKFLGPPQGLRNIFHFFPQFYNDLVLFPGHLKLSVGQAHHCYDQLVFPFPVDIELSLREKGLHLN